MFVLPADVQPRAAGSFPPACFCWEVTPCPSSSSSSSISVSTVVRSRSGSLPLTRTQLTVPNARSPVRGEGVHPLRWSFSLCMFSSWLLRALLLHLLLLPALLCSTSTCLLHSARTCGSSALSLPVSSLHVRICISRRVKVLEPFTLSKDHLILPV